MTKVVAAVGLTTRILPCTCIHPFQDKMYGAGLRVHNLAEKKSQGNPGWGCTVCSKIKPFGETTIVQKKEKTS